TTSGGCCRDTSSAEDLLDVVRRVLHRRLLFRPGALSLLSRGSAIPLGTHRWDRRCNIVVRLDCHGRSRQCGRRRGCSASGCRASLVSLGLDRDDARRDRHAHLRTPLVCLGHGSEYEDALAPPLWTPPWTPPFERNAVCQRSGLLCS